MTVRQDIRDAVIAAINTDAPTGVPPCTKRRFVPGAKLRGANLAAIFIGEDAARVGGRSGALTARSLVIGLQVAVAVEDPAEADDAMEQILDHIVETLGDTNLGALATDVSEVSTTWSSGDQAGVFVLVAVNRWRVDFQTRRADLSSRS